MSQKSKFRIIVIDDNLAIHQDFLKILVTKKDTVADVASMEQELFGDTVADQNSESLLPIFQIDTASQGQEGVKKIAQAIEENNPYALAFVDIRMPPGWDGVETIKHIWEIDNSIQVVICTAYSDYSWEETIKKLGQNDNLLILKKPFDNIAVRQLACALTRKWQLVKEAEKYTESLETRVRDRTESLRNSLSRMRATLESSADSILVVEKNGKINDFNSKFLEMLSLSKQKIVTLNFKDILLIKPY